MATEMSARLSIMSTPFDAVSRALFDSDLWQTWCGEELHIWHPEKGHARQATARSALDAVPDGWAKVNGEWVQVRPTTHDHLLSIERSS